MSDYKQKDRLYRISQSILDAIAHEIAVSTYETYKQQTSQRIINLTQAYDILCNEIDREISKGKQ